ncbi:ABC transporter permease [Nocardioides sambongensis]|uniref:ABC transporter permease n=1 Tax=Nocardioides sambongensis TaxID=2589074 RepID=UPI0018C88C59|nr:ABC transporter permease [Nocardioides sambongensis]
MADTTTTVGSPEPGVGETVEDDSGTVGSRSRRISREMLLMLVVPPVLIALVFLGFVLWRHFADLDSVETNQLRWSEITSLIVEHLRLTFVSAVFVVLTAIPAGILLTRGKAKAAAPIVVGVANAGQAAPAVGLIVLLFLWLTSWNSFWVAVLALTLYGFLPVLRNTITGLQGVDPTLIEAGRGIGMTPTGTLLHIELPLAVPVMMAGLRTALVLIAGTAALAFFIGAGGLGEMINTGITLFRFSLMVSGAVLVALIALLVEWLGRVLEVLTRPKGI